MIDHENEIEVIVVGLTHYISQSKEECNQWIMTLPRGLNVTFEWEPENPFTPGCAFRAYIHGRMVGYASKNDCYKLLNIKDADGYVESRLLWGKDRELHVAVTVPEGIVVPNSVAETEVAMQTPPSIFPQGLNLSITDAESRAKHAMRLLPEIHSDELVEHWCEGLKHTFSNELVSSVPTLCQVLAQCYPDKTELAYSRYKDFGSIQDVPLTVWRQLLDDLRVVVVRQQTYDRWAAFFFGQNATSPTLEQLYEARQRIEDWLMQLPHRIWQTYHHNELEWARMLYYQQPNRENLYRVCTHFVAMRWVNSMIDSVLAQLRHAEIAQNQKTNESESESESKPSNYITSSANILDKRMSDDEYREAFGSIAKLITEDGDWGLLVIALSEEFGIEAFCNAKLPIKRFASLLVGWGLIGENSFVRIYNSMRRRVSDYTKAAHCDKKDSAQDERFERWNNKVEEMMKVFTSV